MLRAQDTAGYVTRGDLDQLREAMYADLRDGRIIIPQTATTPTPNRAGGINHAPNSDLSYSTLAATTPAITPATAGDTNYEAYRFFRQVRGANISGASADALKATGHSLFAAAEGATPGLPRWDRVNGWIELGASGATQYDMALHLLNNIIGPGQKWFLRFRCAALDGAVLPAGVQAYAGIWEKRASSEGWITGGAFTLTHTIVGIPGTTSTDYRVVAKTDSGVTITSDTLNVPNAPDALSLNAYVKLRFNAGSGFIEFQIYRKIGSTYTHVFTVRNSTDLEYNDTGSSIGPVSGFPVVTGNAPQAYAETGNLLVAPFGGTWTPNDLTINIPSTYNFTQTNTYGQYLRFGLTAPTGVDRHIGIDRIYFSTTYNEWSPDSATYPSPPSISPTSGNQGGGDGVYEPPPSGSGGSSCVLYDVPVLTLNGGRLRFRQFQSVKVGAQVKGEHRAPYIALSKRTGAVAEFYVIKTANGITLKCSADHPLITDVRTKQRVQAKQVTVGTELACWVKGRKGKTKAVAVSLIPQTVDVGTFTLRHIAGLSRDGEGLYICGQSKNADRGLFSHNVKPSYYEPL